VHADLGNAEPGGSVSMRQRVLIAANVIVLSSLALWGCSIPSDQSELSLAQSVSALASQCGADSAAGQVANDASTAVTVSLKVTWVSVSGSVMASANVPPIRVSASGTVNWSAKPNKQAPGALSCGTSITEVKAA
jgi:hypothetical protein